MAEIATATADGRAILARMEHIIRAYDEARDLDHLLRCWMEIGWIESEEKKPSLQAFLESSNVEVAEIDGEAEAMTMWTPGSMRYQHTDLPMSGITAVTVSHVARKLGLASILTARSLRAAADAGMAPVGLDSRPAVFTVTTEYPWSTPGDAESSMNSICANG